MSKYTIAPIVCLGLILWSSIVCGQDNRIVYPQVEFGSQFPNSVEIELRLGNLSATDVWQGEIRLLRGVDVEGMDEVFVIDEDGYETLAEDGVFAVEIPADGAGVYCITSNPLQYGLLVVEATSSRIEDLTTSFAYKRRLGSLIVNMDAVQPATAPSRDFRGLVAGTDELDEPFANQESGFAVVSERALSGHAGTTEVEFTVLLEGDETEYSGTITLGGDAPELQSLMLRDVIYGLPASFKVGQLELTASEPVYLSMLGVGSPPVFKPRQVTSVPAQPFVPDSPISGYLQYDDLIISFTQEFAWLWDNCFRTDNCGRPNFTDGSFWEPEIDESLDGFYAVGDLAVRGHGMGADRWDYPREFPPRSSIALVKDAYGDYCTEDEEPGCSDNEILSCDQHVRSINGVLKTPALCPAIEWIDVWRRGGGQSFYIWIPLAPEGYRCLGAIAGHYGNFEDVQTFKSTDKYRCVRKDLLSPAVQRPSYSCGDENDDGEVNGEGCPTNDFFRSTRWEGGLGMFRASGIDPGTVSPGEYALVPGTFVANSDVLSDLYNSNEIDFKTAPTPMAFRLEIDQFINEDPAPLPPFLTGYDAPSPFSEPSDASEVTLPWFAVNDPGMDPVVQAIESPEYTMTRISHYKLVQWSYNRTEVPQSVIWHFSWGTYGERATTMQNEVGVTFGTEFGSEAVFFKAKFQLSHTFTHSRTDTSGWTQGKTFELPVQIPAGTVVAAYQLESVFTLTRQDETWISVEVPYALDRIIFDQYPRCSKEICPEANGGRIVLEDVMRQVE